MILPDLDRRKFLRRLSGILVPAAFGIAIRTKAKAQEVMPVRRRQAAAGLSVKTTDFATRVVSNGGVKPGNATLTAVDAYYNGNVADGTDSLIIADCLFVPDNLIASITPYYKVQGNDPWTNHSFVSGDLSVNGLKGNGSTKYLDTGVVDNVAWASGTELGLAMYIYQTGGNTVFTIGSLDFNNQNVSGLQVNSTLNQLLGGCFEAWTIGTSDPLPINAGGGGYAACVRQSSARADVYAGCSSVPFASFGNITTESAGRPLGFNIFTHALNNNGSPSNFCPEAFSYAGIFRGLGWTATLAQKHFNRVQALRVALLGGYV